MATDAEPLLPIGMFSRASMLSIKMLRAYHEAAILVPASVDPRTGYRAYTVDQLADAAVILRLRALDLPLEQVRDVVQRRDPDHTRHVLAGHQAVMADRLEQTRRIVEELQSGTAPATHTPVHRRLEPARHALRIVGRADDETFPAFLGWAYERLFQVLATAGVQPAGPCGALYVAEVVDDGPTEIEAFVPIDAPFAVPAGEADAAIGEVPAAHVAVLVHTGGYDDIADTYRTLGAWVARHATHAGERVREWYVIGPPEAADPAAYRTEIAWPIAAD